MDDGQVAEVRRLLDERNEDLDQAAKRLRSYLDHFCIVLHQRLPAFYVRLIEVRPKPPKSVLRALDENRLAADQIWTINDMIGGRVVVPTKAMACSLRDALLADEAIPIVDPTSQELSVSETGYRAIHLKGRNIQFQDFWCEIQIRTALEDARAFISRLDLYKGDQELPPLLLQLARIESLHLQAVDAAFDEIIEEVTPEVTPPEPKSEAETQTPEPVEVKAQLCAQSELQATGESRPPEEQVPPQRTWEQFLVLSPDDEFVLHNPISPDRVRQFLESFVETREQSTTMQMLFSRVGAFLEKASVPDDKRHLRAGFNLLVPTGPFVEGSNWLSIRSWDFALGLEGNLLGRLDGALTGAVGGRLGTSVSRDAAEILRAVDTLSEQVRHAGLDPTLIVLTGDLGMRVHIDLRSQLGSPGSGFDNRYLRILASYRDMPILDIAKSDAPAVYVVDVASFAVLTRYDGKPDFRIDQFNEERARALLRENPRLIPEPPPESQLEDARLRQLQLKVGLRLYETWDLEVHNPGAVFGSPLVGPIRG